MREAFERMWGAREKSWGGWWFLSQPACPGIVCGNPEALEEQGCLCPGLPLS
jgi:hypothetical protein